MASVNASGRVTANRNGSTEVFAVVDNDTASVGVSVAQRLAGFGFEPAPVILNSLGETAQLDATPRDAGDAEIPSGVVPDPAWSAANPGIASVTSEGLVTAVGNGETYIRAAGLDIVDSVRTEVRQVAARVSIFGPRAIELDAIGDSVRLSAAGFDALDPDDADCSLALDRLDRDGDGLLDCEERFIGTSPELFDTDADGLPDPVEFRSGTNPVWADANVDMDFDGSLNGNEVAWHTNPTLNDAAQFSKYAYRYKFRKLAGIFDSWVCYEFGVDNITLVGTSSLYPGAPEGYNDIMVYAGQVPQDDPDDYGTFRVACARTRYIPRYPEPDVKYPPSGLVKFKQRDFKRPVATRCASDEECPHHICDPRDHVCLVPRALSSQLRRRVRDS